MHLSFFHTYLDINWKDDGRCVTKIEMETVMSSLIVQFWNLCVRTHKDHIIACCVADVWTGTFPSKRLKSKDYTNLCDALLLYLISNVFFHKLKKIMVIFCLFVFCSLCEVTECGTGLWLCLIPIRTSGTFHFTTMPRTALGPSRYAEYHRYHGHFPLG